MNKPIITLTADFGDTFASSQLESVIYTINPDMKFLIASNQITPFSLLEGSFILKKFCLLTPKGSIHIGVVDPGVGSNRRGIIIKTGNFYFIGPDNGLLYPAAQEDGIEKVVEINQKELGYLSNTFHGRDVFAKIAALVSLKTKLSKLGWEIDPQTISKLEYQDHQVLHIDPYGNIKLSTPLNSFKIGDLLNIKFKNRQFSLILAKTFSDVEEGKLLIYHGSHQTLEIAQNLGSANNLLRLKVGDTVKIESRDE